MSPRYRDRRPTGKGWLPSEFDDNRYSQSVIRAFSILESFSPERRVQGIAEIADSLGMSRSTAHRYVMTMVACGYLEQMPDHRYQLGLRVVDLGMSAISSTVLREHARVHLEKLRQRTGYTASLAVLDGSEIVCVDRVRSFRRGRSMMDEDVRVGSRLPAYCTAMGKVLLAGLPRTVQDEVIGEIVLERRGPNTITGRKALRVELGHVSEEGMAVSDEEFRDGLVAIAIGVHDGSRDVVASVGLAAPTSMVSVGSLVDVFSVHLATTADQISARMGYRRDDEMAR